MLDTSRKGEPRTSGRTPGGVLQIRVIGHASPRWRAARNDRDADVRNASLSLRRAAAIKSFIASRLAASKLPIPAELDVTLADDESPRVTVGGHGEGSREALERLKGDRKRDDEYDRRIDIEARLVHRVEDVGGVSLPDEKRSAVTRSWELTITGFQEIAIGGAYVELDVVLKNPLSGKTATGSATLYGGGINVATPTKSKHDLKKEPKGPAGKANKPFTTIDPVGFWQFDGRMITMERLQATVLGFGPKALFMRFHGLNRDVFVIELAGKLGSNRKFAAGGWVASGRLHLDHIPEDTYEADGGSGESRVTRKVSWEESTSITTPTESSKVSASEYQRLAQLLDQWIRRYAST